MKSYVADYETIVHPEETRVWAWGFCEIGNVENFEYGTTMEGFIKWCKKENKTIYFHNLKFDGEFLFYWLLTNGFRYSDEKEDNTFNCLVSDTGQFYSIEIIFKKMNKRYKKVVIYDSYKKLPFPVSKIGKDFKLPIEKVEVPDGFYESDRPVGHELTDLEILYLKHDVQVVAMALGIQFEQELKKMTIGSDALHNFKMMYGKKKFSHDFPVLPKKIDDNFRLAYKGGYTYVKEEHAGQDIGTGIVYDVNSLYPSVMYQEKLPYGMPIFFTGEYEHDDFYPLYMQHIRVSFRVKPNHLPTIQIKHGGRFQETEYLKSSMDELGQDDVELVLTNVDLELFRDHYDILDIEYLSGWKFKSCVGAFKEYIDHWTEIKVSNSKEKNAMYTLAKLMLNSLYGKFATNPVVTGKYPYINDKGAISYKEKDEETRDPVYTPMGAFITAYARDKTIRAAQKDYARFIYADTDSLHLLGDAEPEFETHDSALGLWACEGVFTRARFLRAKTYIEEFDGELHVTCAGMPSNVKKEVTWENFHVGLTLGGKLMPKHVKGGIVLKEVDFSIK